MKIYNCLLPNGQTKKMTLAKVINYKRLGKPVMIIDVAEEVDKSYKDKSNAEK